MCCARINQRIQIISVLFVKLSALKPKVRLYATVGDLDFSRDEIQKKSTPFGGSENDGNFCIE
jgi:hypothetical protein